MGPREKPAKAASKDNAAKAADKVAKAAEKVAEKAAKAAATQLTPQKRAAEAPPADAAATTADAAPRSPLLSPTSPAAVPPVHPPPGSPAAAKSPSVTAGIPPAPLAGLTPRRSSKPKLAKNKPADVPKPFEVTILQYATNGARVNPDFEPDESAYVLILEHPGSKQHPSCLYQFKDNLGAYLQILHTQDPETPSELIKLVPSLHLFSFVVVFGLCVLLPLPVNLRRSSCKFMPPLAAHQPGQRASTLSGGGPSGPIAALTLLHNFAACGFSSALRIFATSTCTSTPLPRSRSQTSPLCLEVDSCRRQQSEPQPVECCASCQPRTPHAQLSQIPVHRRVSPLDRKHISVKRSDGRIGHRGRKHRRRVCADYPPLRLQQPLRLGSTGLHPQHSCRDLPCRAHRQ